MPEPTDPSQPPPSPPSPGPETSAASTSTGLPSNIAAALACIPLIGGIIFYLLEKRDNFVRFYAMQSIILGIGWFVFAVAWTVIHGVLAPIPGIGWLFGFVLWVLWAVVNVAIVIVWIIAMIKAFSGSRWDIPYVGPMARKYSGD